MLSLKNIVKEYSAGDNKVVALKGVSLDFRKSEFVSVLGQSGCGKTTLLNIIGGLDQYTSGDLVINGRSTKKYKDRDWDTYRNHSIGFVFQSYNLIPHQTVLQNVELALTLSGVSRAERRARAKAALEEVGLGDQLKKKPNEMSGGQMQRVAIARALVNNPDIILADEPTGALDTETSVQVMEILKRISKDRLIIMVTHNPDLAKQYSSRIIRMLDGKITDDSMPITDAERAEMAEEYAKRRAKAKSRKRRRRKTRKPTMSFATSFMLSLKNLFTKKGRTALTAFAGSIGIIGIALILAISEGMTTYIDTVQENTLSSYPLTIEATTVELTTLMETFMNISSEGVKHDKDAVYQKSALYDIVNAFNNLEERENDLKSFNQYLLNKRADKNSPLSEAINGIQYSYDLDMLVYTKNVEGNIIRSDTELLLQELMAEYMGVDMSLMQGANASPMMSMMMPMGNMSSGLWQELLPGDNGAPVNDLLINQYDMIYGSWPNSYDEIVLVVDENNELDDVTLYALGLLPEEDMGALVSAATDGTTLEKKDHKWSYKEICEREYRTILNSDCYSFDEKTGLYVDLRETDAGLRYLYDNALKLKVTGIIRPNENSNTTMITGSICYTSDLTKHIITKSKENKVIKEQLKNEHVDIITGLPFKSTTGELTDKEKKKSFTDYIASMTDAEKAETYVKISSIPPKSFVDEQIKAAMKGMKRADMEQTIITALESQMTVDKAELQKYIKSMDDDELEDIFTEMLTEQIKMQYAAQVSAGLAMMSEAQLVYALEGALPEYTLEQYATYYDEIVEFSDSTYEDNLKKMGYIDLEMPASINIYASSFENKDVITDAIAEYNKGVDEVKQIKYTDYIGIMMSSITTIINAITYVLIAFVAISLVVSSIMIGVITLISVQERTKEIGILRSIGASKRDVSSMFNAETMIVGFASGLLGIVVTYLLCIPINLILHSLTGIENLNAILPVGAAVILVLISVALTLFSGLIPSRSAAKKDPVVALRSE